MSAKPVAGGGRRVEVPPERVRRWLENFAARHGPYAERGLVLVAADGTFAELEPPIGAGTVPDVAALLATVDEPRRLGLLLARKGAVAVGVADGATLVVSKVDRHYVQGRTAAGGWSQQRFARRRDNQAKAAAADGAGIVARLLIPEVRTMRALVTGGDRTAIDTILAAPALAPVAALRADRLLDVPEPRHAVLVAAIGQARAVRILIRDPTS